jgi:hypothetical protein
MVIWLKSDLTELKGGKRKGPQRLDPIEYYLGSLVEQAHIHNLCYLFWRTVWEMPRFTEGVGTHEIHPVYMTVWLFSPISFNDLRNYQKKFIRIQDVRGI